MLRVQHSIRLKHQKVGSRLDHQPAPFFPILSHIRSVGRDVSPLSLYQALETIAKLMPRLETGPQRRAIF